MIESIIKSYGKEFEIGVRGLCAKYSEEIYDPIWSYEDLWQEAEVILLEQQTYNKKKLDTLDEKKLRAYLFMVLKYSFMDIKERTDNRKRAEDGYFDRQNGI
jgi:hypothetical protein